MEEWGMKDAPGTEEAKLLYAGIDNVTGVLFIDEPFSITFKIWLNIQSPDRLRKINFSLVVSTLDGQVAFNVGSKAIYAKQPFIQTTCHIPPNFLNDEFYTIRLLVIEDGSIPLFDVHSVLQINLAERQRDSAWHGKWIGAVRPINLIDWTFKE
jgi:lipopolysaccharide transport system ATP-binding protein